LEEGIRRFRDRLAVSIAAKDGYVAIKGWVNMSEFSAYNFASKLVNKGCRSIIYKDISGDGIPKGLSCNGIEKLCNVEGARITASGGITSLEDLKAVKAAGAEGVIIGKALYAGAIRLEDALRAAGE
jgi:phosphoribosylformimino-5-aminoimidazole carboxamide ribotide isomerase